MQGPLPDNTPLKRQTSMPPTGIEPTIPASERPHTHALDRAATGIDISPPLLNKKITLIEENVIVQMAPVGMFKLFIVRAICPSVPTGSRDWTT
jgi:hypothetical protein